MPYVILKTKERFFAPRNEVAEENHPLKMFTKHLAKVVAEALSTPGTEGELTARDIEVEVREFGKYDVNQADVEIIVFANEYPERLENLEKRRKKIENNVRSWLNAVETSKAPDLSAISKLSIWLPLVRGGAYGEVAL